MIVYLSETPPVIILLLAAPACIPPANKQQNHPLANFLAKFFVCYCKTQSFIPGSVKHVGMAHAQYQIIEYDFAENEPLIFFGFLNFAGNI